MTPKGFFPYKGRIIYVEYDTARSAYSYGYVASNTEADRVSKKFGPTNVFEVDGKKIIPLVRDFDDGTVTPFFPGTERDAVIGGVSNFQLANELSTNKSLALNALGQNPTNTTTTDPNTPTLQGGQNSTPFSLPNRQQNSPFKALQYPTQMDPGQDRIKFQAVEINKRTPSTGTGLNFNFAEPTYNIVPGGFVMMAIQSPISDQNSVDWGPDSLNAIDAEVAKLSYNMITENNPFGQVTQEQLKGAYQTLIRQNQRIRTALSGQAAGVNNILARTDNVILNPNLELLFQAPQLRPFSFQFKMSARNPEEAIEIRKIIRYFKQNMAVRKEEQLFLKAPYVFTIQYFQGTSKRHKSINLISPNDNTKACALTNCSVDYTPLGSYMTFNDTDATMVSYTLSLQFQEITPIYDNDYKPLQEDEIGY